MVRFVSSDGQSVDGRTDGRTTTVVKTLENEVIKGLVLYFQEEEECQRHVTSVIYDHTFHFISLQCE